MRAVVTGHAGFIGGHLTERLLQRGHTVLGIDNLYSGLKSTVDLLNEYDNFIDCKIDIRSIHLAKNIKDFKPDVIFHLAALPGVTPSIMNPIESHDVNVNGTLNLLRSSKEAGAKRIVFSSSSSVYGGSHILPTPEDIVLNPRSPYALHKKIGEEYCKIYSQIYNVETISLRYFNVFGPRQRYDSAYAAVIPSFCKSIVDGAKPIIYGDGMQFRDFTYVENIVNANILAAETKGKLNGEAINIGCGERIDLLTIIKKLGCLEPIFEKERLGDVRCSQADITLANKIINYDPAVKVDDGLRKTLDWYLKNKNIL